ncbi:hypothetical protein [Kitasatospora sp. NPDC088548]|uniref:hypothetical protein n=1 Tax=Kitasatospora sp. NPDC088548 TaxID=3364075 RepID=UPI00382B4246
MGKAIGQRRALGPGGTLAGRLPVPPPRPEAPAAPSNPADQLVQQVVLTATHAVRTEPWRAVLDGLTVAELQNAATAAGADPAHAVTSRIRAALRALARWDEMVGELHDELAAVAGDAGLCEKAREAGLAEEAQLELAWVHVAEVVLRYHHGGGQRPRPSRRW